MKIRYRLYSRFFRAPLVVVQVAETVYDPATDTNPGGDHERWRDATAADIMNGETVT